MRTVTRWVVGIVVVVHGAIHVLGPMKAFGWADVDQLDGPISNAMGVVWLVAMAVTIAAGAMFLARTPRWWWIVGAAAAIVSQVAIVTSWTDAKAGTIANVLLAMAVIHGYAAQGPRSARAEYRRRVDAALCEPEPVRVLTDTDLEHLPAPVAQYVRRSGAVGQAHLRSFRARIHGRIRASTTKPWMTFTGEQVNTYGPRPSRLFFIDATMFGLPVDVLHVFVDQSASMRVKLLSLITMVDAAGPDMDRSETVTVFNDMCIMAPAALVDAPIAWSEIDDHHVRGTFTNGAHTVRAELAFNDDHELVDFVSDDRMVASADGKVFTRQRWSTPVTGYRDMGTRRVGTVGEARWHAPEPDGEFAYLEFHVDDIADNLGARAISDPNRSEQGAQV